MDLFSKVGIGLLIFVASVMQINRNARLDTKPSQLYFYYLMAVLLSVAIPMIV